ncbi:FAD-dependent oxidoreductase [Ningiella sp. W23]|uniref:FAD-dependent oxidoreductase n=1 Tax=Ningiella sp. W23 TaxID=3023715 RepID=UPI0037565198
MITENSQFDVCIIGAGMVGAACACLLARQGAQVALIEPYLPSTFDPSQAPDLRVSALNRHSLDLLDSVGALKLIMAMRYRSYSYLEVWESDFSKTRFDSADIGEQQIGIFAENRIIQLALLEVLKRDFSDYVTLHRAKASSIDIVSGEVSLQDIENESSDGSSRKHHLKAQIIIGADGANSQVRRIADIGQTGWEYAQQANLFAVNMHDKIADETWQQFTPQGPVALLPMHESFASLVWYADAQTSSALKHMDNEHLKSAIRAKFPDRLGDFDLIDKAGFSLTRMHAKHYHKHRAVLIGDSAHTINPLAGQGVNLGFKDVAALCKVLDESSAEDIHNSHKLSALFDNYEKGRRPQNLLMMSSMDALYKTFGNDVPGLKAIRNLALLAAQRAGPAKNIALKYAMGI